MNFAKPRWSLWLDWGLGALLLGAFFYACRLPLYTDEILWRYHFGSVFNQGFKMPNFLPVCQATHFIPIPPTWLLSRSLESGFYKLFLSSWTIRAMGVLFGLLASVVFYNLFTRIFRNIGIRANDFAIFLLSIGVVPFLAIINRPEQVLLLCLMLAVSVSLEPKYWQERKRPLSLISILLIPLFFSAHLKSLFFIPFWICWIFLVSEDRLLRIVNLGLLGMCARDTFGFSRLRTSCEEHLVFQTKQAAGGFVRPVELFTKPIESFSKLWSNLIGYPAYFENALFESDTGSSWFHSTRSVGVFSKFTVINLLAQFVLYGVILVFMYSFLSARMKRRPLGRKRELMISASLIIAVVGIAAFNTFRPFYDSWFTILTFYLAFALLGRYCQPESLKRFLKFFFSVSRFSLVASLAVFILVFAGEFRSLFGVPSEIQKVLYLTPLGTDAEDRASIHQLAPKCGINLESPNLSVDEDVFVKFGSTLKSPYMAFFLMPSFIPKGLSVADILDRVQSPGVIARCSSLFFKENSIRQGSYCCLPSTSVMREDKSYQKWILPVSKQFDEI